MRRLLLFLTVFMTWVPPVSGLEVLDDQALSRVNARAGIDIGISDFQATLDIQGYTVETVDNWDMYGDATGVASLSMDFSGTFTAEERVMRVDVGDVDSSQLKWGENGVANGYAVVDMFKFIDRGSLLTGDTKDDSWCPTGPNSPSYDGNNEQYGWGEVWWHMLGDTTPDEALSGKTAIVLEVGSSDVTNTNYTASFSATQKKEGEKWETLELGSISGSGFRFPKTSDLYEPSPFKATLMSGMNGNAGLAAEVQIRLSQDNLTYTSPGAKQTISVEGIYLKEAFSDDLRIGKNAQPYDYGNTESAVGSFQSLLLDGEDYKTTATWAADFANYYNGITGIDAPYKNNDGYFMIGNLSVPDFFGHCGRRRQS